MAGVPAGLPAGIRLTDHIGLGAIARAISPERVREVLVETGTASERERDLPAQVMVYYVIALALYMGSSTREVLRCLLEGLRWLWGAEAVKVAGKSGISQARSRLGEAPLRRLYAVLVHPLATRASKGAWYRDWRLVSLDGSCLDVADTGANRAAFGMPGASRGASAFPQLRFVALVENGTHVLFGAQLGRYDAGETTLAHAVAVSCRSAVLRPRALASGGGHRGRSALAGEAQSSPAARDGAGRRLLPDDGLSQRQGPAAPQRRHPGARRRVSAGGCGRGRTALSAGEQYPRPGTGARSGAGRALSRALGDRGRARRAEDAAARGAGRAAQQDPSPGAPGVLGPAAGAFRRARAHARSRLAGRRRPRPALLLPRRACHPPQAAADRGAFPLRPGALCIGRCWMRSWRNAW